MRTSRLLGPDSGIRCTVLPAMMCNPGTKTEGIRQTNTNTIQEGHVMQTSKKKTLWAIAGVTALVVTGGCASMSSPQPMSFFVTSTGVGNGADLGGVEGADK